MAKKKSKAKKTINPVAKHAYKFNICKVIDTDCKKYKRKAKHKEVYSGVTVA